MMKRSTFLTNELTASLLAALHSCCFKKAWSEQDFKDLLKIPGATAQILEVDGDPVAFALYQCHSGEAEILTLGVIPKKRGFSFGETLLEQGEKYLGESGVDRIVLEVSETNFFATSLYNKSGFTKIGMRKKYYLEDGKRVDALVLNKKMNEHLSQ